MFTYCCIIIASFLAWYSRPEYRAVAYLVLAEFILHKLIYLIGYEFTGYFGRPGIMVSYIIAQLLIVCLIVRRQNHIIITSLILANLTYNLLSVAYYAAKDLDYSYYNFPQHYTTVVGVICVLELLYLAGITSYAANYRRKYGYTSIDYFDRLFFIRRRLCDEKIL